MLTFFSFYAHIYIHWQSKYYNTKTIQIFWAKLPLQIILSIHPTIYCLLLSDNGFGALLASQSIKEHLHVIFSIENNLIMLIVSVKWPLQITFSILLSVHIIIMLICRRLILDFFANRPSQNLLKTHNTISEQKDVLLD